MRPPALAALALVVALAGCGGSSTPETSSAAIPGSVANRLAAQSESIAAAWKAGDACGAAQQADDLKHAVDKAIQDGQIPAAYQDELEEAAVNLQNTANCPAPTTEDDQGENDGNGKAKGHDKHDDGVTVETDTLTDTTGED